MRFEVDPELSDERGPVLEVVAPLLADADAAPRPERSAWWRAGVRESTEPGE